MTALPLRREGLKAIVFDLDGTLYRDDRLGEEVNQSAIRYVADIKGVPEAEAERMLEEARAANVDGGTLSRAVVALGGSLVEMHRRFAADIHPEKILKPDRRVPELLQLLAPRYQLHLYTNNNRDLSQRIMAQLGITGLFQEVFTIEDFWLPKPEKIVITHILSKIGCRPDQTLFVGDRYQVDLAVPEAMGCAIFESMTVEELLKLAVLVH